MYLGVGERRKKITEGSGVYKFNTTLDEYSGEWLEDKKHGKGKYIYG